MSGEKHEALAECFNTYRPDLLSFLGSRVATPECAEDLLQQTFLRALQHPDWASVEKPEAYLRATARHVLVDHYRVKGAKKNGVATELQDHHYCDETWSPKRAQQLNEIMLRFTALSKQMTSRVRTAFVLSRVYGYTHAEVGEAMLISPRTVEKHVAKGRALCSEQMRGDP